MIKKLTQEEFINRCKEKHSDDLIDYSETVYKDNRTKVFFICKKCGNKFYQSPSNFLNGKGCPLCSRKQQWKNKSFNCEDFIKRAKKKHGTYRYDYSKVDYINYKTSVLIGCKKCGKWFYQIPMNHVNGNGCPECYINEMKKGSEKFIKEANKKFDNKYDYSLVDYKNNKTKVKITCPIHGIFEQGPTTHLNSSYGCPKCATKKVHDEQKSNKEEFIKKANKLHKNKYDYSKVKYVNNSTKVCIICKKCHKEFWQKPNKHLNGQGCPNCKKSYGEEEIALILNNNNILFQAQKKFIGCKNKRLLSFDFYLPDYNLAIEYDGLQHYQPVKGYGGEARFKCQQKKDDIKTNYCYDNDIILCRIKYNQDIYKELSKYLELKEKTNG